MPEGSVPFPFSSSPEYAPTRRSTPLYARVQESWLRASWTLI